MFLLHLQKLARITRLNGRVIPGGGGFILIKAYPLPAERIMAFFVSTSLTKASSDYASEWTRDPRWVRLHTN